MVKKRFNILSVIKILKKIDFYVYFSQKLVHIEKTLMKLSIYLFFIKDDQLLEKYNEIWEKASNAIKRELDSNLVYNKKYLRTKIKSYDGKINTNFQINKIPKEDTTFICLAVISIDFIFRGGKNYYPQVFLEECKYVIKEKNS